LAGCPLDRTVAGARPAALTVAATAPTVHNQADGLRRSAGSLQGVAYQVFAFGRQHGVLASSCTRVISLQSASGKKRSLRPVMKVELFCLAGNVRPEERPGLAVLCEISAHCLTAQTAICAIPDDMRNVVFWILRGNSRGRRHSVSKSRNCGRGLKAV